MIPNTRCNRCAQNMKTQKRDNNTQSELMLPKSEKISRTIPMEEIEEDPMENMDLNRKESTLYAEIVYLDEKESTLYAEIVSRSTVQK